MRFDGWGIEKTDEVIKKFIRKYGGEQ